MKRKRKKIKVKGSMPDEVLVAKAKETIQNIIEGRKQPQKVVSDHYICYGTDVPLCGINLGKRGITKDLIMITCPECKMKLND